MDQQPTVSATSSLVDPRIFWEMKVRRIIQKLEYGQINEPQARHELALLGYDEDDLDYIFEEEE
mgnify:FL=1